MQSFLADARDGTVNPTGSACSSCCCQAVSVRPGETNQWLINYAQWLAPIGGRGLVGTPVIDVQNITPVPPITSNQPPTNTDYTFTGPEGLAIVGSVSGAAADPEAQPLTFARVPLFGPSNGTLAFNVNGSFTYTPSAGFSGYDAFYFETSDGVNKPVRNKVTLVLNPLLGPPLPAPQVVPLVNPVQKSISISGALMRIPVEVSPAAKIGDVYRVSLLTMAMDCDGQSYQHVSCFDVSIGKCG